MKYLPCILNRAFRESEMSAVPPLDLKRTVSVIIPLYNTEKYVAECIESVLDQTLQDLEVLVIDDGSRDHSAAIVEQIARRDSRVRLLRHPGGANLGVSRTRRLGIMEASSEYLAYLDADDAFEPMKLERQVSLMKARPACLLCHTGIKGAAVGLEDQELSTLLEAQAKEFVHHWNGFRPGICEYLFLDRDNALSSNVICNSSVLAVTEAVRSTAAATRQVFQAEDFLQWTLLGVKGPFVFTPEPLTRYRVHAESASYLDSREHLRTLYRMVEFLLSLHALTDDPGLRNRAERELLQNLLYIRDIYAEGAANRTADSLSALHQSPAGRDDFSWDHSALERQMQIRELQDKVDVLTDRLATIRSSKVYRGLVKVRNLFNGIKPASVTT